MSEPKKPFPDPLVRDRLFPEAAQIFEFAPVGLAEALTDGIVAVDTNVLLVPYTTGQASLEQIRRTYERLTTEGRLRIPGQVAREFAENRAEKLKIIFQQLSRKRDTYALCTQRISPLGRNTRLRRDGKARRGDIGSTKPLQEADRRPARCHRGMALG